MEVRPNRLAEPPPRPGWWALLARVASPLNLMLVIAAGLARVVEHSLQEAVVFGLVLVLNGVLGCPVTSWWWKPATGCPPTGEYSSACGWKPTSPR
jgi:Na+/proline symporter